MLAGQCRCENVCWAWSVDGVWDCGRVGTCDRESGLAKKLRALLGARLRQGCVRAGSRGRSSVEGGGLEVAPAAQAPRRSAACAGPRRRSRRAVLDVEPRVGSVRRGGAFRPLFSPL